MNTLSPMESAWRSLEAALTEHAKPLVKGLKPGATEDDLARLQKKLRRPLPAELADLYRVHSGAKRIFPEGGPRNSSPAYSLIQPKFVAGQHKPCTLEEQGITGESINNDPGVQAEYWLPEWIPFAETWGIDRLCLDLAPAPGGKIGQVIELRKHDLKRQLIADSLVDWLEMIAERLASRRYSYTSDIGLVDMGEGFERWSTPQAFRDDPAYLLVKTTKSGNEYWMKEVASANRWQCDEPLNTELLQDKDRWFAFVCVNGEKFKDASGSALGDVADRFDALQVESE
ncbi:MAG: SMI1/KNR4 family protein [Planctomycetota bacterium]